MGEFISFLLRVVYPSILFGASIGRVFNIISAVYFAGFVCFAIWATQRSARSNGVIAKVLLSTFFVVSALTTLGGAVFSVVWAAYPSDHLDKDIVNIFRIIGFEPIDKTRIESLRFFLSDVVVMICSFGLLYAITKVDHFTMASRERISKSSNFNAVINVALLFIISAAFPSVLNIPYVIFFVGYAFTSRWFSITEINSKIWPVILVYNGLHLVALYTFQWQYIQDKVPTEIKDLLGILDYTKIVPSLYPMFVAYAGVALQFMLLCHWVAVFRTYKEYKSQITERRQLIGTKSSWILMILSRFYLNHGWKMCLFMCALDFFFLPSVLTIGVLLNLCLGIMKPKTGGRIAPFFLFYFGIVIMIEWIYNIPYNWRGRDEDQIDRQDVLLNLGFSKFPKAILHLGIHLVLLWMVALFWRVEKMKDVIHSQHYDSLAQIAKQTPKMAPGFKTKRLRRHSTHQVHNNHNNNTITIRSIGEKTKEKTTDFFNHWLFPFVKGIVVRIIGFFLLYSYVISLAGLCLSALQATNLLNTGYMVFFIVFLISRGLAEQIWLAVVFYSQGIILALSVWQIPATGSPGNDTPLSQFIGLIHYPKNTFWLRMIPNVIAMLFTVLQWHLIKYRLKQSKMDKQNSFNLGQSENSNEGKKKNSALSRIFHFIDLVSDQFYAYSLLISYLVVLTVAVFDNFSAVSIMYMSFFFTFSLLHMVSEHALTFVKAVWGIAVLLSAVVLIARYIFQFGYAREWVKGWFPSEKDIGITLQDLGLIDFGDRLIISLTGNIVVLVTFVFQARVFISYSREKRDSIEKLLIRSRFERFWPTIVAVAKRILAKAMPIITTFIIWGIVVHEVSLINLLYFFGLLISNFLPRGPDSMGLLYLLLVEFIVMCKMLCRFSYFRQFDVEKNNSLLKWIGLPNGLSKDDAQPLWQDLCLDMMIMIFLIICRVTSRWRKPKSTKSKEKTVKTEENSKQKFTLIRKNSKEIEIKEEQNSPPMIISVRSLAKVDLIESPNSPQRDWINLKSQEISSSFKEKQDDLIDFEAEEGEKKEEKEEEEEKEQVSIQIDSRPEESDEGLRKRKSSSFISTTNSGETLILANSEEHEEKIDYVQEEILVEKMTNTKFKLFRWYVDHFFTLWGYEIFFLVGTLSLILRNDYLGIIYISFVALQNRYGRTIAFGAAFPLFLLFLVFVLASEYVFLLRAPPVKPEGLSGELQYIWEAVPMRWWDWLTLRNPIFEFSMTFDFLLFFIASKLAFISTADKKKLFLKRDELRTRNAEKFEKDPYSGARYFQFLIFRFSADVILVIIFIIGALQVNVLRFGYIFFSLYLLINNESAFSPQSKGWSWLRLYTFTLILIEIIYQVPIVKQFAEAGTWPDSLLGLKPMSNDIKSLVFDQGITQDVFILVLLWAQKKIGKRPEITTVNTIVKDYEEHAYMRAKHYYEEQRKYEKMKLFRAQKEQSDRWARLISVKNRHKMFYSSSAKEEEESPVSFIPDAPPPPPISVVIPIEENERVFELEPDSQHTLQVSLDNEELKKAVEDEDQLLEMMREKTLKAPTLKIEEENEEMEEGLRSKTKEAQRGVLLKRSKRVLFWIKDLWLKICDIGIYSMEGVVKYKKEMEWVDLSRKKRFINILGAVVQQQSKKVAFLFFFINHLLYANIISMYYPLAAFGYAMMLQGTRPTKRFWNFTLVYASITIFIKFVFFLRIFCVREGEFCVYSNCLGEIKPPTTESFLERIGIDEYFVDADLFFNVVLGDLLIFLAVLWHRNVMRVNGLWDFNSKEQEKLSERNALERTAEIDPRKSTLHKRSNSSSKINLSSGRSHSRSNSNGTNGSTLMIVSHSNLDLPSLHPRDHLPIVISDISASESESEEVESVTSVGSNNSENSVSMGENNLHVSEIEGVNRENEDEDSKKFSDDEEEAASDAPPKPTAFEVFLKRIWGIFGNHYTEITMAKSGSDYYTATLFTQLLIFLFLVFFQDNLTQTDSNMVITMFVNGSIPGSYLSYLLSQFLFIVIDRTIYLFRSVRAKVVFQYFQIILIHVMLFYVIEFKPHHESNKDTYKYNVILYLLEGLYLTLSAMQIANGYPPTTHDQFLTKKADSVREIAFMLFKALPFVFELKTLLDFMVNDTTLFFRDYLKLEDLYGELFLVKCDQAYRQSQKRVVGQKQPVAIKFFQGFLMFIGLVILIWFPLILLSSWVPSQTNFVHSASIRVGFKGSENLFVSSGGDINQVTSKDKAPVSPAQIDVAQSIFFGAESEMLWQPTPISLERLKVHLNSEPQVNLSVTLSVSRDTKPTITTTLARTFYIPLGDSQKDFADLLNTITTNSSAPYAPVTLKNFLPSSVFIIPSNGEIETSGNPINVSMTLDTSSPYQWWWKIEQLPSGPQTGFKIWTLSAKVPIGITAKLASAGLVGLYVGVVLSVGRFLRLWVSSLVARIWLDDMPTTDRLMTMCEDIFIARQYKDLMLEEHLYKELIQLLRDPDRIIDITKKES